MQLFKRKGSPNWWAAWQGADGKRIRRSTRTANKKLAQSLAAKWVEETFMQEHFGKQPDAPFREALMRYAKTQKRDHPKTFMGEMRYRLKRLDDRFGDVPLSKVNLALMERYMDERKDAVSQATAQKEVGLMRAIIYKAHREGYLDKLPVFPKFKRSRGRERWLTMEEEQRLLDVAAPHLKPVLIFALDTGGRRSEVLGLDWKNVNLEQRRITFVKTKNGDDRTIRLTERAFHVLMNMGPQKSGSVFTYKGESMNGIKTSFRRAREQAELDDFRFHDLRHTFASRLVQGGVNLYDVMHLMGHKSIEMVHRYAHLAPDYQEGPINVLNRAWHDFDTVGNNVVKVQFGK